MEAHLVVHFGIGAGRLLPGAEAPWVRVRSNSDFPIILCPQITHAVVAHSVSALLDANPILDADDGHVSLAVTARHLTARFGWRKTRNWG